MNLLIVNLELSKLVLVRFLYKFAKDFFSFQFSPNIQFWDLNFSTGVSSSSARLMLAVAAAAARA